MNMNREKIDLSKNAKVKDVLIRIAPISKYIKEYLKEYMPHYWQKTEVKTRTRKRMSKTKPKSNILLIYKNSNFCF